MADRLIELLYENNVRCDIGIESLAEDIRSIFSDAQPVDRWISCKDRLPNSGDRVIVCTKYGEVLEMLYTPQSHVWALNGLTFDLDLVTYWQPMPNLPADMISKDAEP